MQLFATQHDNLITPHVACGKQLMLPAENVLIVSAHLRSFAADLSAVWRGAHLGSKVAHHHQLCTNLCAARLLR